MEALFAGGFNASFGGPLPTAPSVTSDYFWFVTTSGEVDGKRYEQGSIVSWDHNSLTYSSFSYPPISFQEVQGKGDTATRWPNWDEVTNKPDDIVHYTADNDVSVRMLQSNYHNHSEIPSGAAIGFRNDSTTDNYVRFADKDAVLAFLGRVQDSQKLQGKTLDAIKMETRSHMVPNTLTINQKPLTDNIEVTKFDVGLGNVPNYAETSSPSGTSTTLLATQRCAYEASAAPRLADERKRPVYYKTTAPTSTDEDGEYVIFNKTASPKTFKRYIKHEGLIYEAE